MIEIADNIFVSEESISFKFSRSGGPGGQNVNKVNTKATLFFDLANETALSDEQKKKIFKKLATRTDKNGVVRVISQKHRTQKANRATAFERLGELLTAALKTKTVRKKTRVPYAARQKRLEVKKQRGLLKKQRKKIAPGDSEG
ncbi:MAG: aminoacyl-tRNA hydrolase [Planctomycetes bacterium]|nr:aminoacyl-tRNA hydrolase [Planctomycetota bacterium]